MASPASAWPKIVSASSPPVIVSAPPSPVIVSLPEPPSRTSASPLPVIVSLPSAAAQRVLRGTADERVVAVAADALLEPRRGVGRGGEAAVEVDDDRAGLAGVGQDVVGAGAADERVDAAQAVDRVRPEAAVDGVDARRRR